MHDKQCFRCGTNETKYFFKNNGLTYCRRCIDFNKPVLEISREISPVYVNPNLKYKLSAKQLKLSRIINNSKSDIFVSAVTGSGKTEVTLLAIKTALSLGQRVGFIIPRKAIVIEIAARLRKIFSSLKIAEVYQGSKDEYDASLVVLTAHQSYRYIDKFGLIIVDEYDAFPLANNQVLKDIVNRTCYGKRVYLSATFTNEELVDKKVGYLNQRYHNQPLPEPVFIRSNYFLNIYKIYQLIKRNKNNKQRIICYFPTIKILKIYFKIFQIFDSSITVIHSKIKHPNHVIKKLVTQEYFLVFSTIILERGVTIPQVNVHVFFADHKLFSFANLIQIAGRVGRVKKYPKGDVLFYGIKRNESIKAAIYKIRNLNQAMYRLPKHSSRKS
jgi:competence protein ComFA